KDQNFGMVKLNKILFYSDFIAYQTLGRSVSTAVYQHLPQGPCPHQMLPALNALQGQGALEIESRQTYMREQKRPVALRRSRTDRLFSADELAVVDDVIDELWAYTAKQVSDMSHETMAWRLTDDYDEIPYGTALLSHNEPTPEDLEWLRGLSHEEVAV